MPIQIMPIVGPVYIQLGDIYSFSAIGGIEPVTFTSTGAAGGTMDSVNGDYSADGTTGTGTATVTDSLSSASSVSFVVYDGLIMSPSAAVILTNATQTFTAAGGCLNGTNCVGGARVFSILSGGGSINSSTGVYTAPNFATVAVIQVADSIGNTQQATVEAVNTLTIIPRSLRLALSSTNVYTALAGTLPYTYSVVSGTGTVNASTGVYTASLAVGTGTVRVTDAVPNTSDSAVTHISPQQIVGGLYHVCVMHNEGSVKCWGINANGQLGIGSTSTIGDGATEIGGANKFVDFGSGIYATNIVSGYYHVCAVLNTTAIKCWGLNSSGQLGQNNTTQIGSTSTTQILSMSAINFGGRTVAKIFAFGYVTCTIFDDNTSTCWGKNSNGQLGLGDKTNRLVPSSTAINWGSGLYPTKISGGLNFMCALLNDGSVKCTGRNNNGQLGDGTTTDKTSPGAALDFGGLSAIDLAVGYDHACAVLSDGTMQCWGRNSKGQLGDNSTTTRTSPVATAAIGLTVSNAWAAGQVTCAQSALGAVKCWGLNAEGELILNGGGNTNQKVPPATSINWGTGVILNAVGGSYYSYCMISTGLLIKCWGKAKPSGAVSGIFLVGNSTNNIGDANAGAEQGDGLPYVNY